MTAATWAEDADDAGACCCPCQRPKYRTPNMTARTAPKVMSAGMGRLPSCSIPDLSLVVCRTVNIEQFANRKQRGDGDPCGDDIRGSKSVCDACPDNAADAGGYLPDLWRNLLPCSVNDQPDDPEDAHEEHDPPKELLGMEHMSKRSPRRLIECFRG